MWSNQLMMEKVIVSRGLMEPLAQMCELPQVLKCCSLHNLLTGDAAQKSVAGFHQQ